MPLAALWERSPFRVHSVMASSSQSPTTVEPIEVPVERPSLDESQTSSPHDETQAKPEPQAEYVTGRPLYLVLIGVLLSIFLIAIDQTIVANALPHIASVFNALPQLAWIPTSFLLTQTAFLLIFGQLPLLFPSKWVFTWALIIFELGSLLSGVATSINFLIFARAFQGVGAAGIFVSAISMVADAFGGVFAVSSIVGPLLGGAFVQHVSWRWCFYINLPLSVPTFAAILFYVKAKPPPGLAGQKSPSNEVVEPSDTVMRSIMLPINNFFRKMAKLDWLGATLVLGFTTCLVLALQWGGNTKPWNSGDVIATFVVFGVLLVLFILWQFYKGDKALLPLHLFNSMTVVGCCICAFFTRMALFMAIYYLPLYFQAVKGHSALKSGIDLIPLVLAVVFTSGIGGFLVSKTGRFWHLLFFGPLVGAVCYGVLFTINEHTSWGKLIGLQIGIGIGVGCTLQNTILGVQATVRKDMIPQSSALVTFSQFIGGVLGIAIAGTIFENKLASGLHEFAPDAPYDLLRQSVEAIATLPPDQKAGAIHAYVEALKLVFVSLGVTTSALCSISTLLIKNINLKQLAREMAAEAEKGKEEKKEQGEAMV
ncbi:hypothetical protein BOTBODRAFT_168326 [Botryobasidium botryosum FD-172 SS1]|uniref:Major facilitator superfamily (MFS) profile domain-containing protein n=1 Tax=Botryobasidium botryosum (strain FD-172 SS1) TaxID=930990 RepID=A0A067M277_BOTB1|nr:hypothetical protein BOTBODRAFT_168326 [Botryobasidium botryosum FD-172 SS1]